MRRIILLNVLAVIVLLALIGGIGDYVYQRVTFISTNNARVTVPMVTISSLQTGTLSNWTAQTGQKVQAGQTLGSEDFYSTATVTSPQPARRTSRVKAARVQRQAPARVSQTLSSPMSGTVLEADATSHEVVTAGQPLAVVGDLSKAYVVAYIDEQQVKSLSTGQSVDVYLDAYPGTKFSGSISQIGGVAGDVLSPFASLTASDTRVTERVPVRIEVSDFFGKYIVPGMSAYVKIHR